MAILKLINLTKEYKNNTDIDRYGVFDIDLEINNYGFYSLVGPSGCGKTTLLNVLGLIDNFDSGDYYYNDKNINDLNIKEIDNIRRNEIGFVFQDYKLFENDTVYSNLNFNHDFEEQEIDNVLEKLNISQYKFTKVSKLSGGEKQRVSIARAVLKKPRLILADEPTGNLDLNNSYQIMKILKDLSIDSTVIVVSHDEDLIKKFADKIIYLDDGRIEKVEINSAENNVINNIEKSTNEKRTPLTKIIKNVIQPKLKDLFSILILEISIFLFSILSFASASFSESDLVSQTISNSLEQYDIAVRYSKDDNDYINGYSFLEIGNDVAFNSFHRVGYFSHEKAHFRLYISESFPSTLELIDGHLPMDNDDILISDVLDYYWKEFSKIHPDRYLPINNGIYNICGVYKTKCDNFEAINFLDDNSREYNELRYNFDNRYGNIYVHNCVDFIDSKIVTFDHFTTNNLAMKKKIYVKYDEAYSPIENDQINLNFSTDISNIKVKDISDYLGEAKEENTYSVLLEYLNKDFNNINEIKFNKVDDGKMDYICYVSKAIYDKSFNIYHKYFDVDKLTITNNLNTIKTLGKVNIYCNDFNTDIAYDISNRISLFCNIFIVISVFLLGVFCITMFREIYQIITFNKEPIGICLMLGCNIKEIQKTILFFYSILLLASNIVACIGGHFLLKVINKSLNISTLNLIIFRFPWFINLLLLVLSLLIVYFESYLIMKKIKNNNIVSWMKRGDQ